MLYTTRKLVMDKNKKGKEKEVTFNYVVIEHIDGNALDSEWKYLRSKQKEQISAKLSGHISQLRSIPSPGYYGSIGRRGLLKCVFWTGNDANQPLDGPFDTEQAFNEAMRNNSIPDFKGHDPVFTHENFKNAIVRRISPVLSADSINQTPIEDDSFNVTIIDWEIAG